jgi:hypothetical protein
VITEQRPLLQVPPWHEWPHAPQLFASVERSRHEPTPPVTQQLVPPVHAGLAPHSQVPFVHDSLVAQAPHAAPPAPHDEADCEAYASHVPVEPPTQQPFAHVVESHVHVPLVVSHTPFIQATQALPLLPHELGVCDAQGTQVPVSPPLQQP